MKQPVLYSHLPLSEFFDLTTQKPWEPGVYRVDNPHWICHQFSYWNGTEFMMTMASPEEAYEFRNSTEHEVIHTWAGVSQPYYTPLDEVECRDLTAMLAGAPWPDNVVAELPKLFAIYEGLRFKNLRPVDPAAHSSEEEQAAFQKWVTATKPEGDADTVRDLWIESRYYREWICATIGLESAGTAPQPTIPESPPVPSVGDLVEITEDGDGFYFKGDKARIVGPGGSRNPAKSYYGDFNGQDNKEVRGRGFWFIFPDHLRIIEHAADVIPHPAD